jgi:hypothetical protein
MKLIKSMTGYKATDKDMCCRGFQFKLGEWYEHQGELKLCESGFHFCEQPSGVWNFYQKGRVFECEAEDVLDTPREAGAAGKRVCRRIRLTREIALDGENNAVRKLLCFFGFHEYFMCRVQPENLPRKYAWMLEVKNDFSFTTYQLRICKHCGVLTEEKV